MAHTGYARMESYIPTIDDRSHTISGGHPSAAKDILLLTSSTLIDRVFLTTRFITKLQENACARVWALSARNNDFRDIWSGCPAEVEPMPDIRPFPEFPHNMMRRLNEMMWDYRHRPPSRMSMYRHVQRRIEIRRLRVLRPFARALALLPVQDRFESELHRFLLLYERSPKAGEAFRRKSPAAMLATGPFQYEQPAIMAAARKLGIPTLALIPSWDNITTKGRIPIWADGYVVWSDRNRDELLNQYPHARNRPVYVVGAPQFDVFFDERFSMPRGEFCCSQGLRSDRPIILYAIGSPNFLKEHHGAVAFAERVVRGELGDAQLVVRPHPMFEYRGLVELFGRFPRERVIVQRTRPGPPFITSYRDYLGHIRQWVNSFRHADVVVNLSSTSTVDAIIMGRPVVNLDFDPQPGGRDHHLVKDVNHLWTHFRPVAASGGIWLVNTMDEMVAAVRAYLSSPELHEEGRNWIAHYVCQHLDGCCGERLASAVLDFAHAMSVRFQSISPR